MDGFKIEGRECIYDGMSMPYEHITRDGQQFNKVPNYTSSHDAIISLIQKQSYKVKAAVYDYFTTADAGWTAVAVSMLDANPEMLCDALLHATRKTEE